MAALQEVFSGLYYGWAVGESGWNTGMDANMQKIGILLNPAPKSMTTDVASIASPVAGDLYIVPSGATGAWAGKDNSFAIYTGSVWTFITAKVGMIARVQDLTAWYGVIENGTWAVI
jgi:hypothetical protein